MSMMMKIFGRHSLISLLFGGLLHKIWSWKFVFSMNEPGGKSGRFGLIGTITNDIITYAAGQVFQGLGGILYQAAALCGLGKEVFFYTNLGKDLSPEVKKTVAKWPGCQTQGIRIVSGPGNNVFLHYPANGERIEILESHVPPLKSQPIIEGLPQLGMLIFVVNSGFDITLRDWRRIARKAGCPIWFDVHSLVLSRNLHSPRHYRPVPEWKEWAEGVTYLQANLKEVGSLLGDPAKRPSREKLDHFGQSAFEIGIKAVFITQGKKGVLVLAPGISQEMRAPAVAHVADTTGCGDVFCAGAASKLSSGAVPLEAAASGLRLASEAARVSGVEETYAAVLSRGARRQVDAGKTQKKFF